MSSGLTMTPTLKIVMDVFGPTSKTSSVCKRESMASCINDVLITGNKKIKINFIFT